FATGLPVTESTSLPVIEPSWAWRVAGPNPSGDRASWKPNVDAAATATARTKLRGKGRSSRARILLFVWPGEARPGPLTGPVVSNRVWEVVRRAVGPGSGRGGCVRW